MEPDNKPLNRIRSIFVKGLLTLLPITLTFYILYNVILLFENALGHVLRGLLPENSYVPGLGLILTLALIFVFGLLLNNFITYNFWSNLEKRLLSVPLIKAVYSPLRDLMNLFSNSDQQGGLQSVVLVSLQGGPKMIGLVTREVFHDLAIPKSSLEGRVAVYLPMSYGLGGFTVLLPRESLEKIDLPIEKALQLAITGWVKTPSQANKVEGKK